MSSYSSLNITAITVLPDVEGDEEELEEGWDAIVWIIIFILEWHNNFSAYP
jgi:hypothetical protein